MGSRTREVFILSLVVTVVVVALILLVFYVSGNQDLLVKMLNTTAEGDLSGIAFVAGGPFAMWVVAFAILMISKRKALMKSVKLFLQFPESDEAKPPPKRTEYPRAKCSYATYSVKRKVGSGKPAAIHMDKHAGPYINVEVPNIESPTFVVQLKFNGWEWSSDSYSIEQGSVDLH